MVSDPGCVRETIFFWALRAREDLRKHPRSRWLGARAPTKMFAKLPGGIFIGAGRVIVKSGRFRIRQVEECRDQRPGTLHAVSGGLMAANNWFALRRKISGGTDGAVIIRPAVDSDGSCEISTWWWRRSAPFESGRVPGIVVDLCTVPDAPEEIK